MRGVPLTVIGDGAQTRCFTYVDDVIRATMAAAVREETIGRIINIGSDKEVSVRHLAELMIRLYGSPSSITFVSQESVYGHSYEDIPRRVPDLRLMREILQMVPQVSLEEGLRRTLDWFRKETAQ